MTDSPYPGIADYGFIADCHASALVSRAGSIDWACMERFDRGSSFARILDWRRGGYCQLAPPGAQCSRRRYLDDTLVLETTFESDTGEAQLIDCYTMREGGQHEPYRQILRVVEGIRGHLDFRADVMPVFDYGQTQPWIRAYGEGAHIAIGGNSGLLISGDVPLKLAGRHHLGGSFRIEPGQRLHLSLISQPPEELDEGLVEVPAVDELEERLKETIAWWRAWAKRGTYSGAYADQVRRSSIVLKGLTHAPSGGTVAAATTSLPESQGGSRNWDYRYTWIRDSVFMVRSLAAVGHVSEADGFRRFVERSATGSIEQLQILYGVDGGRHLTEYSVDALEGYGGARPVRIGNAAEKQIQLDVYGELADLAWLWYQRGHMPEPHYREFLIGIVDEAARRWRDPDRGIWEMRGEPRHFVYSKAMCWAALDRGIRMAEHLDVGDRAESWTRERDALRHAIETEGYDAKRGVFVQAYGSTAMDASLLLLPATGFVGNDDERMDRTAEAIWHELADGDGLLRRYATGNDSLGGTEGTFLACTFWLVECLARQGKRKRAHETYKRALAAGNDLGLFSEEYDARQGGMLGNFPQALTHLSLISAAVALGDAEPAR